MWQKHGLFILPQQNLYWCKTHCMIPTPMRIEGDIYRIYFSGRDERNRSHIGYATVSLGDVPAVVDYSQEPVLCPGRLGCFDDNGVTPSCIIRLSPEELALYYIGWNPGSTVRMHLFGGLAISQDNGRTFKRWSEAPILERTQEDPLLNTAPWVVKDGDHYRIFYVSGCEWKNKDLPRYNIKTGTSSNGKVWERKGDVAIDFKDAGENALARPFVLKDGALWRMWFAYKGSSYKIGYAESVDGVHWDRLDDRANIECSQSGFDNEMIEYAAIIKARGREYMLYNGNNYGYDGIGLAVRV